MIALVRLTDPTPVPDGPLTAALAAACSAELGYKEAIKPVVAAEAQYRLETRLLALGIQPFTRASVERYKDHVDTAKWMQMFAWMSLALVPFGFAGWALLHLNGAGLFGVFIGAAWVWGTALVVAPVSWEWQEHALANYRRPVPASALALALTVRRELNLTCHVVSYELHHARVADPFLVVRDGDGAEAYLAVWDEPSFKG